MPIVTGYEDTPAGHDALVLGAQLARLTGMRAVVASVYPQDGRGVTAVARDPGGGSGPRRSPANGSPGRGRTSTRTASPRWSPSSSGWARRTRTRRWPTTPTRWARPFWWSGRPGTGSPGGSLRAAPCSGCCRPPPARSPWPRAATGTSRRPGSPPCRWPTTAHRRPTGRRRSRPGSPAAAAPRCASSPSPRPPSSGPPPSAAVLRGLACAPVEIDALADVVDGPWRRPWPTCRSAPTSW